MLDTTKLLKISDMCNVTIQRFPMQPPSMLRTEHG